MNPIRGIDRLAPMNDADWQTFNTLDAQLRISERIDMREIGEGVIAAALASGRYRRRLFRGVVKTRDRGSLLRPIE